MIGKAEKKVDHKHQRKIDTGNKMAERGNTFTGKGTARELENKK